MWLRNQCGGCASSLNPQVCAIIIALGVFGWAALGSHRGDRGRLGEGTSRENVKAESETGKEAPQPSGKAPTTSATAALKDHVCGLTQLEDVFHAKGQRILAYKTNPENIMQRGLHTGANAGEEDVTGFFNWSRCSEVICNLVIKEDGCLFRRSDTRVIELGCGRAICGILAARFAQAVVLTDGSPAVLDLAMKNVEANESNGQKASATISYERLLFGSREDERRVGAGDVIIGSELLYHNTSVDDLMDTISACLRHPGEDGSNGHGVMVSDARRRMRAQQHQKRTLKYTDDFNGTCRQPLSQIFAFHERRGGTIRELCCAATTRGLVYAFLDAERLRQCPEEQQVCVLSWALSYEHEL